mmetsp:Transcript_77175/g.218272  ORF Transcript_77175/g.218272 Transcript_77175/m.218272 type:complete len:361 (+) Transcript_77175:391-1473(+)
MPCGPLRGCPGQERVHELRREQLDARRVHDGKDAHGRGRRAYLDVRTGLRVERHLQLREGNADGRRGRVHGVRGGCHLQLHGRHLDRGGVLFGGTGCGRQPIGVPLPRQLPPLQRRAAGPDVHARPHGPDVRRVRGHEERAARRLLRGMRGRRQVGLCPRLRDCDRADFRRVRCGRETGHDGAGPRGVRDRNGGRHSHNHHAAVRHPRVVQHGVGVAHERGLQVHADLRLRHRDPPPDVRHEHAPAGAVPHQGQHHDYLRMRIDPHPRCVRDKAARRQPPQLRGAEPRPPWCHRRADDGLLHLDPHDHPGALPVPVQPERQAHSEDVPVCGVLGGGRAPGDDRRRGRRNPGAADLLGDLR